MNILIFDTETGGINCNANDILQLSYQVIDSRGFNVIKEVNHFFPWPEDKSRVQRGAIKVNGLTYDYEQNPYTFICHISFIICDGTDNNIQRQPRT